jgi:hypothetical protein
MANDDSPSRLGSALARSVARGLADKLAADEMTVGMDQSSRVYLNVTLHDRSHSQQPSMVLEAVGRANGLATVIGHAESADSEPERLELHRFPHLWELLGYLLPRRTRERVFTPAYNDLLADYAETRHARFRTPWAHRWLRCCFGLHTVLLVLQCSKGLMLSSAAGTLLFFVPVPLRKRFWTLWGIRQ